MDDRSLKQPSKIEVALPYFFSLLLLTVVGYLLSAPHLALKDMPEFYAPGRLLLAGTPADIYKPEVFQPLVRSLFPEHEAPILYIPPYGLPLLAPFGFLPPSLADIFWFVFLISCVLASVIVLKKTLALQHKHVMRISGLLCLSGPEWEAIRHGQLTPPLLLSLCYGLLVFSRMRSIVDGAEVKQKFFDQSALAALALTPLLLKPQLAIPVIVYLAGAVRYKVIAWLAAFGAFLNVVSLAVFGSNTFVAYFDLLKRVKENRVWQVPEVTPTIRGQLLRLFPDADFTVMLISLSALVAAMICIYSIGRKYKRSTFWYEYLALGAMPIGLFTALHCHNYDLLLLLPTIVVFMFGASTKNIPSKRKLVWLLPLVPLIMPIYNKVHYEYLLVGAPINLLFIDLSIVALSSVIWLLRGSADPTAADPTAAVED